MFMMLLIFDEVIKPISRLTSPLELGPSMLDGLTSPSNIAIIRAITAFLSQKFFFNLPPWLLLIGDCHRDFPPQFSITSILSIVLLFNPSIIVFFFFLLIAFFSICCEHLFYHIEADKNNLLSILDQNHFRSILHFIYLFRNFPIERVCQYEASSWSFLLQNSVAMRMKLSFAKSTIANSILLGSIFYCSDVIMVSGHGDLFDIFWNLSSSETDHVEETGQLINKVEIMLLCFPASDQAGFTLCILKRSWSVDQQSRDHVDGESDQAALTLCRAGSP